MADEENNDDLKKQNLRVRRYFQWTNEVVEDFTGNGIIFDWDYILKEKYYPFGYINHQSMDLHREKTEWVISPTFYFPFWSESEDRIKRNMKDYIFNNKYCLIIDNDNH